MASGFIPRTVEQKFKQKKNGEMVAITRSKFQQLKGMVDDGKIDTNQLEKTLGSSLTVKDEQYINRFERHVERGVFATNLDIKVGEDMRNERAKEVDREIEY